MSVCPSCGAKIESSQPEYCLVCYTCLIADNEVNEPSGINKIVEQSSQKPPTPPTEKEEIDDEKYPEATAYSKGSQFEDMVERILKAQRYTTQRRLRLQGKNTKSEIDILAVKKYRGGVIKLAVECKNYLKPVPVKDVRDFLYKLKDLGIPNGLFVTYSRFSSLAQSELEGRCQLFWDGDTVREKFCELEAGRGKPDEKKVYFEYNLPLNIDYTQAIRLDLSNKEKIETSAELKWRPFFKIFYEVDCRHSDPIKKKHRIQDSGFYVINALFQTPKEEKETELLMKELEQTPAENQSFDQPEEYRLIKLDPHMQQGDAKAQTIDYVIQKNTKTLSYEVPSTKRKRRDDIDIFNEPERREWILKPSPRDVRIREIKIVYAPKWEIGFQSRDYTYVRIVSGNSRTVLADTITYCSKHWLGEFLGIQKKNVAVCDTCGQALCQEHVFKCPVCTSWQCEKHSIQCAGCKKMFCADHIKNKCIECSRPVCDSCALRCPICGEIHCNGHMTKCSRCGKSVCVSCTRKEGGLVFKKTVCKNC